MLCADCPPLLGVQTHTELAAIKCGRFAEPANSEVSSDRTGWPCEVRTAAAGSVKHRLCFVCATAQTGFHFHVEFGVIDMLQNGGDPVQVLTRSRRQRLINVLI